ncbi:MAG: inorganic diphosphatase [Ureaplasma sp.]|nr:inorganic diphosphatase [Ureaplasma sp.]MDE7221811.1 inorganic diphosphatase [Ureaplasma sp.]
MKVNVIIEIPKHSNVKYEYDRTSKSISVDRILYGSEVYPQNYGFLKDALDYDGDELDVLVIADQEFMPGVSVPTRIIGAMEMVDSGETDTKLIGVIDCDPRYKNINDLSDLNEHILKEISNFFQNYKILQNKKVVVKGFKNKEWAEKEYNICKDMMNKYGSMPKDEFVELMRKQYPDKYE